MSRMRFSKHRFNVILILSICIIVFIVVGFTYGHFTKKQVMTWFPPGDSEGKPITTTEQIVNETQSDNEVTIYLRAIYYQEETLYLSYSTKGNGLRLKQRSIEVYLNNKLISSGGGGGMNQVKDTIYWCFGLPLSKHLAHGDKITLWIVKYNGEKTNLKFDLTIK